MGDLKEDFRAMADWTKRMKKERGEMFVRELDRLEIDYRVHNNGYHLKVMHPERAEEIDLWPTSGKWKSVEARVRYGLEDLLRYLGVNY